MPQRNQILGLLDGLTPHDRYRQSQAAMAQQFDRPTTEESPLTQRGGLLPFGQYESGAGFAMPGMVTEPVNSIMRLLQNGYQPGTNDTQGVEDAFNVAGALGLGSLAAPRPRGSVGMGGAPRNHGLHFGVISSPHYMGERGLIGNTRMLDFWASNPHQMRLELARQAPDIKQLLIDDTPRSLTPPDKAFLAVQSSHQSPWSLVLAPDPMALRRLGVTADDVAGQSLTSSRDFSFGGAFHPGSSQPYQISPFQSAQDAQRTWNYLRGTTAADEQFRRIFSDLVDFSNRVEAPPRPPLPLTGNILQFPRRRD